MTLLSVVVVSASAKPQTVAELAMYKGADRQQILEAGAKKEGKLTFYTSGILKQAVRPVVHAFEKKYPFIKVRIFRGDSENRGINLYACGNAQNGEIVSEGMVNIAGGAVAAGKENQVDISFLHGLGGTTCIISSRYSLFPLRAGERMRRESTLSGNVLAHLTWRGYQF